MEVEVLEVDSMVEELRPLEVVWETQMELQKQVAEVEEQSQVDLLETEAQVSSSSQLRHW